MYCYYCKCVSQENLSVMSNRAAPVFLALDFLIGKMLYSRDHKQSQDHKDAMVAAKSKLYAG